MEWIRRQTHLSDLGTRTAHIIARDRLAQHGAIMYEASQVAPGKNNEFLKLIMQGFWLLRRFLDIPHK